VEPTRTTSKMIRYYNTTFIALIPKEDNPITFKKFNPISLCSCIYKIISNVIARRLENILSKQIFGEEFSFLEGRQLQEAIGITQ